MTEIPTDEGKLYLATAIDLFSRRLNPPFGPVTVAKAYRLLRAVLNTAAVEDEILGGGW
jgi:hypothetical protein